MKFPAIIDKQYLTFLNNPSIKVVSFDIFDTLAFRNTHAPIDIFYRIGKLSYVAKLFLTPETFQQFRIEAEKQARQKSEKEEITLPEIYARLPITKKQQNKIMLLELEEEKKAIYINQQILGWIDLALKYQKQVIFITDIYFNAKQIDELVLSKLKNRSYRCFISCETRKTKRTGKLFIEVLHTLNVQAKEMLHIGDNFESDIISAKKFGIQTLNYDVSVDIAEQFFFENKYLEHNLGNLCNIRKFAALQNPFEDKEKQFFFHLGATLFGSIIWDMCHWLIDLKTKYKIKQINFLMREGRIFEKFIYKIDDTVKTNLIFASRKSTFLIGLNEQKIAKGEFEFYGYENISIQSLYDLHGLQIVKDEILYVKNFVLKKMEMYTSKQNDILKLVSQDFSEQKYKIIANIKEQKKLFITYMQSLNVIADSILVEFGGTGTIPSNIDHALPKNMKQKINALFYIHQKGNTKMLDKRTFSFIPYNDVTLKDIDIIGSIPAIIEILFNGTYNTTLLYHLDDHCVRPMLQDKNPLLLHRDTLIEAFDKGVESFFEIAKYTQQTNAFLPASISLKLLSRLIDTPTIAEANFLGELLHESGHGSSHVHPLVDKKITDEIRFIGIDTIYKRFMYKNGMDLGEAYWIPAHITRINPYYIPQIRGMLKLSINDLFIQSICNQLDSLNIQKISVYGAGILFEMLLPRLQQRNIGIETLIDKRAEITNFQVAGYHVCSLQSSSLANGSTIVIASNKFKEEIINTLHEYAHINNIQLNIL